MNSLPSTDLSVSVLSWLGDELREEIARRETVSRRTRIATGMKSVIVAGVSGGMSLMFLRLLQF